MSNKQIRHFHASACVKKLWLHERLSIAVFAWEKACHQHQISGKMLAVRCSAICRRLSPSNSHYLWQEKDHILNHAFLYRQYKHDADIGHRKTAAQNFITIKVHTAVSSLSQIAPNIRDACKHCHTLVCASRARCFASAHPTGATDDCTESGGMRYAIRSNYGLGIVHVFVQSANAIHHTRTIGPRDATTLLTCMSIRISMMSPPNPGGSGIAAVRETLVFSCLQKIRLTGTLMRKLQCRSLSLLARTNHIVLGHHRHRAQHTLVRLRAQRRRPHRIHLCKSPPRGVCWRKKTFFAFFFVGLFECANRARTQ